VPTSAYQGAKGRNSWTSSPSFDTATPESNWKPLLTFSKIRT